MRETVGEIEIETVRMQARLFASFREQLVRQAARYHGQGRSELEEILQEALHSDYSALYFYMVFSPISLTLVLTFPCS